MTQQRRDNYEYTKEQSRSRFLEYDQEQMIRRFSLRADENHLYVPFAGGKYRIDRATGAVEKLPGPGSARPGNYEEVLTIYDVLCSARPEMGTGKNWCLVNSLPGVGQNSGVGESLHKEYADRLCARPEAFRKACLSLGGKEIPLGDLGFEIPVFPFFPVRLRLYFPDEEFPAQLSLLFHDRTLYYMRYETTFYVASCLMEAVFERMKE